MRAPRGEAIDPGIGKSLFIRAEGGGDRQSSREGRQNKVVLGGSCGLCPGVARGAREQPSSEPAFALVHVPIPSLVICYPRMEDSRLKIIIRSNCPLYLSGVQKTAVDLEDFTWRYRLEASKPCLEVPT